MLLVPLSTDKRVPALSQTETNLGFNEAPALAGGVHHGDEKRGDPLFLDGMLVGRVLARDDLWIDEIHFASPFRNPGIRIPL